MNTDKELVELLESRNESGRYGKLISAARNGDYHDFKTNIPFPKLTLANDLSHFPELHDIRQAVINGDYDEEFPKE